MTRTKESNEEQNERMGEIAESQIQGVNEIDSDGETIGVDQDDSDSEHSEAENLEDDLEKMEAALLDDGVGDISKPKITLKFRSARFTHLWDLNATNKLCICEKEVTKPTETDLQKRATYSNYTVSRCGCAYHSACINAYVNGLGNGQGDANCPLCRTQYEPLPNQNGGPGVYQAV